MRVTILAIIGVGLGASSGARGEVAPSISQTLELHQQVDMDCVAAAAAAVPGLTNLVRSTPPEPFVASPDEGKVDKFVYVAPGFGGSLTFAPSFLGNALYFRHTVDFPEGPPSAEKIAEIRAFMKALDRTLAKRCDITDLGEAEEHCAAIPCPHAH